MKKKLFLILTALMVISISGCKKEFDDLEKDQNRPTNVPPYLVLNGILSDITYKSFNPTQRWNQFYCCNYNYYGNQEYNWNSGSTYSTYSSLTNVLKMEQEAERSGLASPNAYTALGKFFRAYLYYNITMQLGDVPMTEALKGIDNLKPKYDSQKEVFKQILKWLEESNDEINTITSKGAYSLSSDYFYNNDLKKWRMAVNSFKLRVLMQLSKHENDADLNVKQKFADVISNPGKYPIFTTMSDNMVWVPNSSFDKYPTNPDNFGFDATRYNMASTYLNTLAGLKDPRTFFVAEPADSFLRAGKLPTDHAAFNGAGSGEDLAIMSSNALKGIYSYMNRKRYYSTYTAENIIQIGYPELCFNIAEAINRGWLAGNAEEYYTKGVQSSISFYGIVAGANTVTFQKKGGTLSESEYFSINYDWNAYYNQSSVKYAGNSQAGLNQILTQKYLAFYQNSGAEAYYNWRRTNVPAFHTGPGTANSQRIPLRFSYPSAENNVNTANLKAAISSQFGSDDINEKMWIIK